MELKNPYAKLMRTCKVGTALSVLGMVLGIVVGAASPSIRPVGIALGAMSFAVFLLCLVTMPVLYFMGRSELKKIRELVEEGNYWAHWTYGQEEWQRFAESEWTRTRGRAKSLPWKVFAMFLVIGVLLSSTSKDMTVTQGLIFGAILGVPLGLLVGLITHFYGRSVYRGRLASAGEVYIGTKGVYQDGTFWGLKGFGLKLQKVEVQQGDPSVLHFEVRDSRGRHTTTNEVRVAVPRGREAEAAELAQRFQGEI